MKKRILSLILAVLMLLALTACGSGSDRVAELEAENAALKAQIEELEARLDGATNLIGMTQWEFKAVAWSGNNGANITFTGVPETYEEGHSAVLSITLEGEVVDTAACEWNGTAYTANTDLNAADGYCYYCVITDAYGNESKVELNTPKNPMDETVINIETSLASYCSMTVEESVVDGNTLTITAGYARAQLPVIGQGGQNIAVAGTELVLLAEGKEVGRVSLTLEQEETANCFGASVDGVSFTIPAMEDDQQLELKMEVTLSDGQVLTAPGGNWFANGGELFLVVG